jgi:putative membrane protein
MDLIDWLRPWEFSPTLLLMFVAAGWVFLRGVRVHRVGLVRQLFFWSGFVILYLSLHTHLDYYAERMFFIHRVQHLVLHHLGPLLIMGAYPGQVMRAGLPMPWRVRLRDFRLTRAGRAIEATLTNKYLVPLLFVVLVLGFLIPTVQFYSMLDWRLYRFMNWSVVISGFMYWNLILDRRPSPPAALSPGGRVISPIVTMVPQMVVGAIITFTEHDLYPIFDLCGRAIPGAHGPGHRWPDHVGAGRLCRGLRPALCPGDPHAPVGKESSSRPPPRAGADRGAGILINA